MKPNVRRAFHVACTALVCCCLLSSCAHWPLYKIKTQEIATFAEEPAQRIPLRAGFFTQFDKIGYGGRAAIFCQTTDKTLVDCDVRVVFEQATRRMFKEVVPLTAKETVKDWKAKNLDVVVTTGPASCLAEIGRGFGTTVELTLMAQWFVISADGKPVTSMLIKGEGQAPQGWANKGIKDALVKALDAHSQKLYDQVVMTAWWRDSSWKPE